MYDYKKVLKNLSSEIDLMKKHFTYAAVDTKDMKAMANIENQVCALRDIVYAKYNKSDAWAANNYITGKSAIIHETHSERRSITKAIERGKLLQEYDSLMAALNDNLITSDHLDLLSKINDNKYAQYLHRDIDLLVENAIKLDALHFSYVIRHWKNIVDDQRDETNSDYQQFENHRLFLSETLDGTWVIQGQLDKATGILLNKALEDIVNKLWRNDSVEQRHATARSQYRADAIGYLAQGYISKSINAKNKLVEFNFTPTISSDVIIDIDNLNRNRTTRDFLTKNLDQTSPIHKAH